MLSLLAVAAAAPPPHLDLEDIDAWEAEQVLDPVAVLRLLELEFIVLCLNFE